MKHLRRPGLYENLLTEELVSEITAREQENWEIRTDSADRSIRPALLAHHIYCHVRRTLESMQGPSKEQARLVNQLIDVLLEYRTTREGERISETIELLLEAIEPANSWVGPLPRPTLSMRRTGLLVNGRGDVRISGEIVKEIPSANRIDLLCAFIRYSGLRLFQRELEERRRNGAQVRVITSVYTGTTERRALDTLVELGAEVKVSYDTSRTRLHAKAWLFHRDSGLHTAYIGSSNLTHSAQVDGLEWNVRVSSVENSEVIEHFEATFEQYWLEPEFEKYDPEHDGERLDHALCKPQPVYPGQTPDPWLSIDFTPKPHQTIALEALESERNRGHHRNLVVAATGTGKTWIAAFDFMQLRRKNPGYSLLFVAHRDEILRQSRKVFQLVLQEPDFGELLVGGEHPTVGHHVFASVQSLGNRMDRLEPGDFDVIIVDEFHHAAASSYERLLTHFHPEILLGLTATPERADGKSILAWFDGRIAYQSRLWDALDQGLLCPFHYFGIHDPTDLSGVRFQRGRYLPGDLDNLLTGDDMRAQSIRGAVIKYVTDPHRMRALGFCAGIAHAHFMADKFCRFGFSAVALDASTPTRDRIAAKERLRRGEIRAIFTVDLFNEGIDLPEVDTLLLLRPTESATVFLQQLGRGLRWSNEKPILTVLDFVGQARREYRYDIRYRALLGGTRHQVRQAIDADFPMLPPGCSIRLDRIAKKTILDNLKQAIFNAWGWMVEELRTLGPETRLVDFLQEANVDIGEIYLKPQAGHCFTELRRQAGFVTESVQEPHIPVQRAIGRLLHVDDPERLETWLKILKTGHPRAISSLQGREYRLGLMLFAILGGHGNPIFNADPLLRCIHDSMELHREYCDLLEILLDRIRTVPRSLNPSSVVPLKSHATYTLGEIMAACHRTTQKDAIHLPQTGVLWDKSTQTDLLFVTLEKTDKHFSPSTRYADYPISPTLFHWETQNHTTADSPTGQRYIRHSTQGSKVILFVRERKKSVGGKTVPYHCLGEAHYQGHESERPMKIRWKLDRPMPGWLYQAGKVVAG